jgi:FkbM family methyltransferase
MIKQNYVTQINKKPFILNVIPEDIGIVPGIEHYFNAECLAQKEINKSLSSDCSSYLDIGANLGMHLIPTLVDFPEARIVAIEGSSNNIKYINQSLEDNRLEAPVYEALLGNGDEVYFNYSSQYCAQAHVIGHPTNFTQIIKTKRLKEILGESRFDVIKIDIEGSEKTVIEDSPEIFEAAKKIIIEFNNYITLNHFGYNCSAIYDFLFALGFVNCSIYTHDGKLIPTNDPRQTIENNYNPHFDAVFTK